MKIEKKYRVYTEDYFITEVNGLIDDDGKLIAAADPGDKNFYETAENDLFFDTEDAARKSLAAVIPTDEEIKKVLKFLNHAPEEMKKAHDETIKTVIVDESYLYKAIYGEMYNYIVNKATDFLSNSIIGRLKLLVRQRILNIDGISVPIDNISHVKWGEKYGACKLILKNGTEVFCSGKEGDDLWFVELVFGHNESGKHFPNLHR